MHETGRYSWVRTTFSLAVQLIDRYTGRQPDPHSLSVTLAGLSVSPIRNHSGLYVFTDLPDGVYHLCVSGRYYLPFERSITVRKGGSPSFVTALLMPDGSYSFGPTSTLVRVRIAEADGRPVCGVPIRFVFQQAEQTVSRLARSVVAGESQCPLTQVRFRLREGDQIALGDERAEYEISQVRHVHERGRCIELAEPLLYKWEQGTAISYAAVSRSDGRGEAVLFFLRLLAPVSVGLLIVGDGAGVLRKEVIVREGSVTTENIEVEHMQ